MAFQIQDDLLDLCGTEKQIGKPPGSDMRQGNITLPVIFALEDSKRRSRAQELDRIHALNGQCDVTDAVKLVTSSDGIPRSEALADRYIRKALAALDTLPDIKTKTA